MKHVLKIFKLTPSQYNHGVTYTAATETDCQRSSAAQIQRCVESDATTRDRSICQRPAYDATMRGRVRVQARIGVCRVFLVSASNYFHPFYYWRQAIERRRQWLLAKYVYSIPRNRSIDFKAINFILFYIFLFFFLFFPTMICVCLYFRYI